MRATDANSRTHTIFRYVCNFMHLIFCCVRGSLSICYQEGNLPGPIHNYNYNKGLLSTPHTNEEYNPTDAHDLNLIVTILMAIVHNN